MRAKNFVKDFMNYADLKPDIEFTVKGIDGVNPFKFSVDGALTDVAGRRRDDILAQLMLGTLRVVPKPFVLEFGKTYYHVDLNSRIWCSSFDGDELAYADLECGNIFGTWDSAEEHYIHMRNKLLAVDLKKLSTFVPKLNKRYFYVCTTGVSSYKNEQCSADLAMIQSGNCFKNEKKAIAGTEAVKAHWAKVWADNVKAGKVRGEAGKKGRIIKCI